MEFKRQILLIIILFVGCNTNKKYETNEKYDSTNVASVKDSIDNNSNIYICDTISIFDKYIIANDSIIYKIKDIDTLFDLADLNSDICDTSSNLKRINVINQIMKNKNLDGYVGEFLAEIVYNQFEECPCLFYKTMNYYYDHDSHLYGCYKSYLLYSFSIRFDSDSVIKKINNNIKYDKNKFITKDLIEGFSKYR